MSVVQKWKTKSMSNSPQSARLNFRLAPDHKRAIEAAAAALGQTVSDFAIATLVRTAHRVIQEDHATKLSRRDRDTFLAMLDDKSARPNKALRDAAKRYKKQVQQHGGVGH
jgi:uncharacterized protein (DUF1778 family)